MTWGNRRCAASRWTCMPARLWAWPVQGNGQTELVEVLTGLRHADGSRRLASTAKT
ncbi:MAG: hypothetical protein R2911_17850 [Caldilineaceae bacterium]